MFLHINKSYKAGFMQNFMALEFLFDVDDTLIYNQFMYTKVYVEFINFLLQKTNAKSSSRRQGEELTKIVEKTKEKSKGLDDLIEYNKMDRTIRNINNGIKKWNTILERQHKKKPYFKERVPRSFQLICEKEYNLSKEVANEAYKIGLGFHNVEKNLIEGAEEVLNFLQKKECRKRIYTCGDSWLQQKKIEVNGLNKYFDKKDQIIVPRKHNGEIIAYLGGCNPDKTFMVGNSIRDDINPSVRSAGIRAIYFPTANFYTHHHAKIREKDLSRITIIKDLRDIITLYDSLSSLK